MQDRIRCNFATRNVAACRTFEQGHVRSAPDFLRQLQLKLKILDGKPNRSSEVLDVLNRFVVDMYSLTRFGIELLKFPARQSISVEHFYRETETHRRVACSERLTEP